MHWTSLTLGFFCTPNVLTKNDLLYNLICLWHFSIKSTVFYLELRSNVFDQLKAKAFRNAISHNALTLQTYNKHTKHILSFDMLKRTLQVQCNTSVIDYRTQLCMFNNNYYKKTSKEQCSTRTWFMLYRNCIFFYCFFFLLRPTAQLTNRTSPRSNCTVFSSHR